MQANIFYKPGVYRYADILRKVIWAVALNPSVEKIQVQRCADSMLEDEEAPPNTTG